MIVVSPCHPATPAPLTVRRRRRTVTDQQLELMHLQTQGRLLAATGPPAEASLRKPFLAEPKALAVIQEDLKGSTTAVREYEQRAGKRVEVKSLTANLHQPVNAFAKIHRLDRQQQTHLRRELNHERCLQSPWAKARAPALSVCASRRVSFEPARSSSSITHCQPLGRALIGTSTNSAAMAPDREVCGTAEATKWRFLIKPLDTKHCNQRNA